ncbi:MAG: hypothetical protein AB1641_30985 [Thermodesulfobacteriota bacterium]
MREYFGSRGIQVSRQADQSTTGRSTGVARILKYAESMVHIYNVKTKQLDKNLDFLEPNQKVVVFNLTRLDMILGSIKANQIDRIVYDGRDLFLPAAGSAAAKKQ